MVKWYRRAAKSGDVQAIRDIGFAYKYGTGVKVDVKLALAWYKKAARKNDPKAFYNLGLTYLYGDGVIKSSRWAKYYLSRAAAVGHQSARQALRDLS